MSNDDPDTDNSPPEPAIEGSLRDAVDANPLWYHTIDLGDGVITPGWFDQRSIVASLPWPDVRGKRCLDIGTYDGFLAFELEGRGAAEVVATDISEHSQWDWPAATRAQGPERLASIAGPEKGRGFRIAREALGSSVKKVEISVYDLSPGTIGTFDVVVCGALLLHLRDPIQALEAIRGVCRGRFLSIEAIDAELSVLAPRRPVARLIGTPPELQWWVPNKAGHRRMLEAAGFEPEGRSHSYPVPLGPAHWARDSRPQGVRRRAARARRQAFNRLAVGADGVPHVGVLSRPRV